jgi:hypothetical protein
MRGITVGQVVMVLKAEMLRFVRKMPGYFYCKRSLNTALILVY